MAFLKTYEYAGKYSQAISLELCFFLLELNMDSSLSPYSIKTETHCCQFRVNFDILGCFRENVIPLHFILNLFTSDMASGFLGFLRACWPSIWRNCPHSHTSPAPLFFNVTSTILLAIPETFCWFQRSIDEWRRWVHLWSISPCTSYSISILSHGSDGIRMPWTIPTSQGRWEAEHRSTLVQNLPVSMSALSSPISATSKLKVSVPLFKSPHQFLSWIS